MNGADALIATLVANGVTACFGDASGRAEAVPGIPPAPAAEPAAVWEGVVMSSVFCELTITEWVGSKFSSLCSPLFRSHQ